MTRYYGWVIVVSVSRCWATIIGGCGSKMSSEHYISKSQYGGAEKITVQGFSWCPEPKEIGIGSAVAKILCKTHNEALSPVDKEAKRVLDGLTLVAQRSAQDLKRRAGGISPTPWPSSVFLVNGELFERWLLKTTINLALVGQRSPRGGIFGADGNPERRYVEIAFGRRKFDPPEGFRHVRQWKAKGVEVKIRFTWSR